MGNNNYTKYDEDFKKSLVSLHQNGKTQSQLCKEYGVSQLNHSQVSRHKKAQFFRGSGYFVCSQYKASASLGVSILSVPCGLFVL